MITYSKIFDELKKYLRPASESVYHLFGSPEYLDKNCLAIHRSFDKFCKDLGIEPKQRSKLRQTLKDHYKKYPQFWNSQTQSLFDYCPREFLVRGVWTSEDVK